MFRLHKTKQPAKSGERIDFKFSQFKVLQVPKGWDKLFVSIISVETGKTIAKSSKAAVKNGGCQWLDTVSESIWISSQDGRQSSKELEDCPYKLLVAMGSARSGVLGEALVNMATNMSSSDSVSVSFPLDKCNHGTILQLKIQCLTPRPSLRDDESKETNSIKEDNSTDPKDVEIKSEESDNSVAKSARSYSSRDLGSITHQQDQGTKGEEEAVQENSFPSSDSHHSYNSAESMEREEHNLITGQDLTSSENSVPRHSSNVDSVSQSAHSSFNSRITHSDNISQDDLQECAAQSLKISGSSKSLLEAAEDTIEDLRGEAKMWERNARKLMLDLELLRKEYSEQSKNQLNLAIELSAASTERDGLQKEVEQLKLLLEKSIEKPAALEELELKDKGVNRVIQELKNEIKFQKESNADLILQLNRSQESNAELVSVLHELEESVEKQKPEIANLQVTEKNQNLVLQLQQLQESEMFLQAKMQELQKELEDRNQNLEKENSDNQRLLDIDREYKCKISAKENEIVSLKAMLSQTKKQGHCLTELESSDEADGNLKEEIESLKAKLQELENDCQELTDENLELLVRLKEMKNKSEGGISSTSTRFELSDNDSQIRDIEEKKRENVLKGIEMDRNISIQELENLKLELECQVTELSKELNDKREVIERLEAGLQSKEKQIENLQGYQRNLEDKFSSLQKEKSQLEENMEIVIRESDISMKCMNDLQTDLTVLRSSVATHVSANKSLERKSSEIESDKRDLETHLSELEQENEELSACISVMEAQIRNLTDDRESMELELENSKSNAVIIQDEIARMKNEMETQKRDTKQKLEEMQNRWLEAQVELEHLRSANPKLQATAESLMEECNLLQKSNGELKVRKLELEGQCNHLETKLHESQRDFSDCSKRVSVLQDSICSLLEQSASKERSLSSELDVLLKENEKQNKKLSVANQMYVEKMVLVENLQQEIGELTEKLSATQDERERITSDAANEVSNLQANIAKLESELNTIRIESRAKIQGLTDELASSKGNQEMLKADNGKMLKLLENYRSCEAKFKSTIDGLELKLTVSEYERQQFMEECTELKSQLLKIEFLEDEVLTLKNELSAIKSDKEELGSLLNVKSEECKELKTEKNLCIHKITELQKAVSVLEDCKLNNISLEEKLQQLENDLIVKEALCEQEAELKNELNRIKRTNKQLQQQNQQLEEEKQKCRSRAQSLEEELITTKEKQRNLRESRSMNSPSNQHQRELLEDELSKSMEANNAYKAQVKRMTSEGRKGWSGSPRKSKAESEFVPKEKFERTKSTLEAELKDLRERYFHMSLKYAEVEAEREQLVMKLKTANNGKRWF